MPWETPVLPLRFPCVSFAGRAIACEAGTEFALPLPLRSLKEGWGERAPPQNASQRLVERPPHPDLLPLKGEKERRRPAHLTGDLLHLTWVVPCGPLHAPEGERWAARFPIFSLSSRRPLRSPPPAAPPPSR